MVCKFDVDRVGVKMITYLAFVCSQFSLPTFTLPLVYCISNRDNWPSSPPGVDTLDPPPPSFLRIDVIRRFRAKVGGRSSFLSFSPMRISPFRSPSAWPLLAPGGRNPPSISRNEGEQSHEFSQKQFHGGGGGGGGGIPKNEVG